MFKRLRHPLILSLLLFQLILLLGLRVDQWPGVFALPLFVSLIWYTLKNESLNTISFLLTKKFLVCFLLIQTALLTIAIIVTYLGAGYNAMDTGISANKLQWLASKGIYYSSILRMHGYADHFTPSFTLFAFLFKIKSSVLWLVGLKLLAYLLGAGILYKIAKHYLVSDKKVILVLVLYLVNYPMQKMLQAEFHSSALATPLIILSFYLFVKNKKFLALLCLIFMSGFKPHLPLAIVSFGLWAFLWQKQELTGMGFIGLGLLLGFSIVYLVTPAVVGDVAFQLKRFDPFAIPKKKLTFVLAQFFSVGFIPFLSWRATLVALPAFGISMVSNQPMMNSLGHYYQDLPMTIMFISVILGLQTYENRQSAFFSFRPFLSKAILIISLMGMLLFNRMYASEAIRTHLPIANTDIASQGHALAATIDQNCKVFAMGSVLNYFIAIPDVEIIDMKVIREHSLDRCTFIINADYVNHWPFNADTYQFMKKELHDFAMKNAFRQITQYPHYQVYVFEKI